jgi:hypothetical protein
MGGREGFFGVTAGFWRAGFFFADFFFIVYSC